MIYKYSRREVVKGPSLESALAKRMISVDVDHFKTFVQSKSTLGEHHPIIRVLMNILFKGD